MIEEFTYKLFQNYITEFIPEIKWLDIYQGQYNYDRPFKDVSCFIEFEPRVEIKTSNNYINKGKMIVNFHLTYPKSDNYTINKNNINNTFKLFEVSNTLNGFINILDSSSYPTESVYQDNMLIEATDKYELSVSKLIDIKKFFVDKLQVYILSYEFDYNDMSSSFELQSLSGWTYDLDEKSIDGGFYNDDYNDDYNKKIENDEIWIDSVKLSGTTLTILGQSWKDGVAMDLEYGVSNVEDELPTYQLSNIFTLTSGLYWIYFRDQLGRGVYYSNNPISV